MRHLTRAGVALAMLGAISPAQAFAMTVSEPGIVPLLGLGALIAVLTIRYLRR